MEREKYKQLAHSWLANHISMIAVKADGSKSPALSTWVQYQVERAEERLLDKWIDAGYGLAILGGDASDNLIIFDFDEEGLFDEWEAKADPLLQSLLKSTPIIITPKRGRHVYIRCSAVVPDSEKLAMRTATDVRIETRGRRAYVLAPYCPLGCHTARRYYSIDRGSLLDIPVISLEQLNTILDYSKTYNLFIEPERPVYIPKAKISDDEIFTSKNKTYSSNGLKPGDDYNNRGDVVSLLERHGWEEVRGSGASHYFTKPGSSDGGTNAELFPDNYFRCYSTAQSTFDTGRNYSAFGLYAELECSGDFSEAAKKLREEGYGS